MTTAKLPFQLLVPAIVLLLYGVQGCSGVRTLRLKEARTLQADSTHFGLGILSALPPPALTGDTLSPERQIPMLFEFTAAHGLTDRLEFGGTAWISGPFMILTVTDIGIEPSLTLMLTPRTSMNTWSMFASGSYHRVFREGFTTAIVNYSNRYGTTTTFGGGLQYQRQLSHSTSPSSGDPSLVLPDQRESIYGSLMLRKIQGNFTYTLGLPDSDSKELGVDRSFVALHAGIGGSFQREDGTLIIETGVTIPLNTSFDREPWIISLGFTALVHRIKGKKEEKNEL